MNCGRNPSPGFQTCCRRCATGQGHDGDCDARSHGAATAGHVPGHVVPGHVVSEVMPPELAGHGQPGPVMPHGHPSHPHPMHPVHPPCGPGPSYAAPGSFLLCIESAKDLYDVDWTGKMDPYVIVRSGGREFRTPVMTNAGRKAKFNWAQMVDWRGEPDIHFIVMDSNFMVADGLIGEAVYKGLPLHSDFKGALELIRKHTFGGCRKAGKLKVAIQWQRPGAPGPMPAIHHGHGAHGAHGAHAAPGAGYIPGHPPVGGFGGHDAFGVSAAMAGQMLLMGAYGPGKKMKKDKKEKKFKHMHKKSSKHSSSSSSSSSS